MWPSISIVVVNRNAAESLGALLKSVRMQKYPIGQVEVLVIDGGSTDQSFTVACEYNAKWISGGFSDNQEARRAIGIVKSNGQIIVSLDADNILPNDNWLMKLISPFIENSRVGYSFTKWYGRSTQISATENYFALIGGNDLVSWALGKNDRVEIGSMKLPFGAHLVGKQPDYEIIDFPSDNLPTLGCNGFCVRRNLILPIAERSPALFLHIDSVVEMLDSHPGTCGAIVHECVIHGSRRSIWGSLRARTTYLKNFAHNTTRYRRYRVLDPLNHRDLLNLIIFIMTSTTVFIPVLYATSKYIVTKDLRWYLHPFICLGFVVSYGIAVVRNVFRI